MSPTGSASKVSKAPRDSSAKQRAGTPANDRVAAAKPPARKARVGTHYLRTQSGFSAYVTHLSAATPMEIVEIERAGVSSSFLLDLSEKMDLPQGRLFSMLGVSRSTAARKIAKDELVDGRAAIGMIKLLALAREMLSESTSPDAKGFDIEKWLGRWIELPQPALGGRKPSDLMDTPTGVAIVAKALGAIQSGAYQ